MNTPHNTAIVSQFGSRAQAYVESPTHAQGDDLIVLGQIVQHLRPETALDLGAGGGHVSYAMAPHARRVIAVDLSHDMLTAVLAEAQKKALDNIGVQQGAAEALPFDNGAFDFLACRYSAHHWQDFEAGLREARRVLKQGSHAVFMDTVAPANCLFDTHLQTIELLRDTSHVRNYTLTEWVRALEQADFAVNAVHVGRLRLEFSSWIARMRTPDTQVKAILALQQGAAAETRAQFAIETDGSFTIDKLMVEVRAV